MTHLAAMADGGLARLRAPGGRLSAGQLRAVAAAAETLGSGVVDLTSRANLQIRGLAANAGPALVSALSAAGFAFHGEADRRRNILLDPFSGLDPTETRDMRPLADALDRALIAAPWIAGLSPKFSYALDGGGRSGVEAVPSDVTAVAEDAGVAILAGDRPVGVFGEDDALRAMTALAEAAAGVAPDARAKDVSDARLARISRDVSASLPPAGRVRVGVAQDETRAGGVELGRRSRSVLNDPHPRPLPTRGRGEGPAPRFGAVATSTPGRAALSLPVPVGRLDPAMLRFLAAAAEREGDGSVALAPWSGVVLPGVAEDRAATLLDVSETAGFTPVAVAERLSVAACAGSPACERAREPAKALGAEILALAAVEPWRLPQRRMRLHLSACPKGCAGSAPADLLLLGDEERPGWTVHRDASPRRPGVAEGAPGRADAARALALLAAGG